MQNDVEFKDIIQSSKRILELALLSGCIDYETALKLTPKELLFFANLYVEKHNKEVYIQYLNAYFNRVDKLPDIQKFYLARIGEEIVADEGPPMTPEEYQEIIKKVDYEKLREYGNK
jgi:hypothetical protein